MEDTIRRGVVAKARRVLVSQVVCCMLGWKGSELRDVRPGKPLCVWACCAPQRDCGVPYVHLRCLRGWLCLSTSQPPQPMPAAHLCRRCCPCSPWTGDRPLPSTALNACFLAPQASPPLPPQPAGGAAPVPPGLGEDPRPPPLRRHRHPQGPGPQGECRLGCTGWLAGWCMIMARSWKRTYPAADGWKEGSLPTPAGTSWSHGGSPLFTPNKQLASLGQGALACSAVCPISLPATHPGPSSASCPCRCRWRTRSRCKAPFLRQLRADASTPSQRRGLAAAGAAGPTQSPCCVGISAPAAPQTQDAFFPCPPHPLHPLADALTASPCSPQLIVN